MPDDVQAVVWPPGTVRIIPNGDYEAAAWARALALQSARKTWEEILGRGLRDYARTLVWVDVTAPGYASRSPRTDPE